MEQEKTIVVVTKNEGKIKEIKTIFSEFKIVSFKELGVCLEVEENADTFMENALKKAIAGANKLKTVCLADDSGICIEAFEEWPGVKTARWKEGTDEERNKAILEKMKGLPHDKRRVKAITAIAIAKEDWAMVQTHTIQGYISQQIRGNNGFGFDSIFELKEGKTLAELSNEEKNKISARKIAMQKIKKYL